MGWCRTCTSHGGHARGGAGPPADHGEPAAVPSGRAGSPWDGVEPALPTVGTPGEVQVHLQTMVNPRRYLAAGQPSQAGAHDQPDPDLEQPPEHQVSSSLSSRRRAMSRPTTPSTPRYATDASDAHETAPVVSSRQSTTPR